MIYKKSILFLIIIFTIGCNNESKKSKATESYQIINIKEYLSPFNYLLDNPRVDVWIDSYENTSYTILDVSNYNGLSRIEYTSMDSDYKQQNVWKDAIEKNGLFPLNSYSRTCIKCDEFKFLQKIGDKTVQIFYDQYDNKVFWTQEFRGIQDDKAIFDSYFIINDGEFEYHQIYYFKKGVGLSNFESGDFSRELVDIIPLEEFKRNYLNYK